MWVYARIRFLRINFGFRSSLSFHFISFVCFFVCVRLIDSKYIWYIQVHMIFIDWYTTVCAVYVVWCSECSNQFATSMTVNYHRMRTPNIQNWCSNIHPPVHLRWWSETSWRKSWNVIWFTLLIHFHRAFFLFGNLRKIFTFPYFLPSFSGHRNPHRL